MIFVIGGKYNDKLNFVKHKFAIEDADIYYGESKNKYNNEKVIYNFQEIIKKLISEEKTAEEMINYVNEFLLHDESIIICDEAGYGIVPIKKEDRNFREQLGRVCCYIAKHADEVYRVMYGIETKIKG